MERHEEHHEAVVEQEQTHEDVVDTVPTPVGSTDFERPSSDFRLDAPHTSSINDPFMATRAPSPFSGNESAMTARAIRSSTVAAYSAESALPEAALSEAALPETTMPETDARSTSPWPSANAASSKNYVPVEMPPVSMFSVFDGTEAEETPSAESSFNPTWKVEQFTWPRVCRRLLAKAGEELDQLVDALMAIQEQGQKVLAISGWHAGEGATTLLLCAARRLAERGIKPVLIDADLIRPRLAKRLGVRPQISWNQAMAQGSQTSLDQAVVESEVHNIALATGCEREKPEDASSADRAKLPDCITALRNHYDMVLVDLGPLEDANLQMESSDGKAFQGIDAMVLVRDQRLTSYEQMSEIQGQLRSAKITVAGMVENFVDL
jgi:Mrp family chromosome partitioning ATPase